jgi:hypothetical protein
VVHANLGMILVLFSICRNSITFLAKQWWRFQPMCLGCLTYLCFSFLTKHRGRSYILDEMMQWLFDFVIMTSRTPPCVRCLKIDIAKNRMCSHVNDTILIGFDFSRGFQIRNFNWHASPGVLRDKIRNLMHVTWNMSKDSECLKNHYCTLKISI